jgi:hypothetical protein
MLVPQGADTAHMGPDPGSAGIAAHVRSVSARSGPDTDRLIAGMLGRSWPGGTGDRTETAAREWVQRWAPRSAGVTPQACSCKDGHCPMCN